MSPVHNERRKANPTEMWGDTASFARHEPDEALNAKKLSGVLKLENRSLIEEIAESDLL